MEDQNDKDYSLEEDDDSSLSEAETMALDEYHLNPNEYEVMDENGKIQVFQGPLMSKEEEAQETTRIGI